MNTTTLIDCCNKHSSYSNRSYSLTMNNNYLLVTIMNL